MKIAFTGDIMLGRRIAQRFGHGGDIVDPALRERIGEADLVVANLESVVAAGGGAPEGALTFRAAPAMLDGFGWVDCFSLANNHINDCGTQGMAETIGNLDAAGIGWNGLYRGDEYEPLRHACGGEKAAVVMCTDMMNREFSEDNPWKTPGMKDECMIMETIAKCRREGCFTILYAHAGMLFSRFPSPQLREFCRRAVDTGAAMVVTVHPHVVGGMEQYGGGYIFYSLGDFVMDGNSSRRRRAVVLETEIEKGRLTGWQLVPSVIDRELTTRLPLPRRAEKIIGDFVRVSCALAAHEEDYGRFYARRYRLEMAAHYASTFYFILRTGGIAGIVRALCQRRGSIRGMLHRICCDRSHMRYDTDAVKNHKSKRP